MSDFLLFALTGLASGLLAGLFGVGGGLIMVPALVFTLPSLGVSEQLMQVSVATSLAVIALTSISSTRSHHQRGAVRWGWLRGLMPGLVVGAFAGATLAHGLKGRTLELLVGFGAVAVALQMFWASFRAPSTSAALSPTKPTLPELLAAGGVIGVLSSLVGIGGGSLTVPYLHRRGLPMAQAVGSAAAGGIPIAWGGALGFVMSGWDSAVLPHAHWGYVSLPAFASLAVFSVIAAPWGAKLAHGLPPQHLKRAFALLLLLVGGLMLSRTD